MLGRLLQASVMRSLTVKLTLAFLLLGITGALLVALFVGLRTQREFDQFLGEQYQQAMVSILADYYQQNGSWEGIGTIMMRNPYRRPGGRDFVQAPVILVDADGLVVEGGRRYRVGQQLSPRDADRGLAIEVDGATVGQVLLDSLPEGAPGLPESPEASFLRSFRDAIILSALGAGVIALILGVVLARTISRPVRELTEATHRVAQGELGLQVTVRTADEVGELATSFNRMSTDLASATLQRRQMTADIAHELRTPLSVILGYTEALADGKLLATPEMYESMHGEARLLNHLIDDLRTLSLADAGELPLNRQPCQPHGLLERIAAAHSAQAQQRGIDLQVDARPDLAPILVDPERMAQVLGNLVSNALRYTPSGGKVYLRASAQAADILLQVQDTGVGIPPDDLPYVFDRFYRGDKARMQQEGESGLGLAIARSLIETQGGRISAESTPGLGSTFTISFPKGLTDTGPTPST